MKATVSFKNVRVYNINEFMVLKGEEFELKLGIEGEVPEAFKWFSDNDQTLELWVDSDGMGAAGKADEPGTSTILVMNSSKVIVKEIKITVVELIPVEADVLEATAEVIEK